MNRGYQVIVPAMGVLSLVCVAIYNSQNLSISNSVVCGDTVSQTGNSPVVIFYPLTLHREKSAEEANQIDPLYQNREYR